jgi:probable rRNA maturation factor
MRERMNNIDVTVEYPVDGIHIKGIEALCQSILEYMEIDNGELSILLCDDHYIKKLNNDYRGIDRPTDVLSFPQGEGFSDQPVTFLGDIVISVETCKKQAITYKVTVNEELKNMLIHGILHLLGFDHSKKKDAEIMREKENMLKEYHTEVKIV